MAKVAAKKRAAPVVEDAPVTAGESHRELQRATRSQTGSRRLGAVVWLSDVEDGCSWDNHA